MALNDYYNDLFDRKRRLFRKYDDAELEDIIAEQQMHLASLVTLQYLAKQTLRQARSELERRNKEATHAKP